jgi:hypothetical protein
MRYLQLFLCMIDHNEHTCIVIPTSLCIDAPFIRATAAESEMLIEISTACPKHFP